MINADNAKSKRDRVVFFSRKTSQLLRRWISYKDRYFETDILFPTKRCGQLQVMNFEKNFKKYITLCGIKKYVTPHSLRNNLWEYTTLFIQIQVTIVLVIYCLRMSLETTLWMAMTGMFLL